jgi:16S rRNA (guanine527-N7)-methyltransferase
MPLRVAMLSPTNATERETDSQARRNGSIIDSMGSERSAGTREIYKVLLLYNDKISRDKGFCQTQSSQNDLKNDLKGSWLRLNSLFWEALIRTRHAIRQPFSRWAVYSGGSMGAVGSAATGLIRYKGGAPSDATAFNQHFLNTAAFSESANLSDPAMFNPTIPDPTMRSAFSDHSDSLTCPSPILSTDPATALDALDFPQRQLLLSHLEAVVEQNKRQNLTSINKLEQGKLLHLEDALTALPEIAAAPDGELIDIGSGAGYPGIPLALVSGRQTTLLEANKRKAAFLKGFVESNGLKNQIAVVSLRAEEYARITEKNYTVATARAVAELPVILEYAAPFLACDGIFVAYKARLEDNEKMRGASAAALLGFDTPKTRRVMLSDGRTVHHRTLLSFIKKAEGKARVPRRPGMAKKRPLA